MKYLSTLFVFFLILSQNAVFSQNDINNYKYVSVPDRFDFLKSTDQYQVNSLTKFLLEKNGFLVLDTSSNYPSDLENNRCLPSKPPMASSIKVVTPALLPEAIPELAL